MTAPATGGSGVGGPRRLPGWIVLLGLFVVVGALAAVIFFGVR